MIHAVTRSHIASLLRAGHSDARVARDCKVCIHTVRKVRKDDAIPRPVNGTATENRRKGEAIILRRAGFTLKEIGHKMGGISKQRVAQLLHGMNVTVTCAKCGKPIKPTKIIHYFHDGIQTICTNCFLTSTNPTQPKHAKA